MAKAKKKVSYRVYLEVREPDGSTVFVRTDKILGSPDLQARCIEKRQLRAIIAKLRKHGMLRETVVFPGPETLQ